MSSVFLWRLLADLVAAGLLVFGLSYWWLGNTAHELAGTAMFLLLIAHNVLNRRFYGMIARTRREARGLFNVAVTLALIVAMAALLVTSVLISNTLSGFMSPFGGFTARQIHTLAAYWVLVIVAVHLGLRWPVIMGVARNLFGIAKPNAVRAWALRLVAVAIAVHGVWSSFALAIGTKLTMQMTLDWWNFEESVAGFFVHCVAIAGLYICLTYYAMKWLQARKRGTRSAAAIPENVHQ
ncbi:DUF4405 domain-containing protein [Bradyrhizobium cenepequi]